MTANTSTESEPVTDTVPVWRFDCTSNNEHVIIYSDGEDQVIQHEYDGLPARGTVRYDIEDFEITDAEFYEDHGGKSDEEVLEMFRAEIREYVEAALFSHDDRGAWVSLVDSHELKVKMEGDEYIVELITSNKRRVE